MSLREMTDSLRAALSDLAVVYEADRAETAKALETLIDAGKKALVQLQKIRDMMGYLTLKQRTIINGQFTAENYSLEEINKALVVTALSPDRRNPTRNSGMVKNVMDFPVPADGMGLGRPSLLKRMDTLRKNLVQFRAIRMRAIELTGAIDKSIRAFNYQYRHTCRRLFPLGFISRLWRSIKRLFSNSYFSHRDMGYLKNLILSAGLVLKMAEAPLF
jgi:hypothetical protein